MIPPRLLRLIVLRLFGLRGRGLVEPSLLSSLRLGRGRSRFSAPWRGPRAPAQNRPLGHLPVVAPPPNSRKAGVEGSAAGHRPGSLYRGRERLWKLEGFFRRFREGS